MLRDRDIIFYQRSNISDLTFNDRSFPTTVTIKIDP